MTTTEHVLFVHAHPDDETIDTGGTLATLVDGGARVTLLTCTRGERGEVVAEVAAKGSKATASSEDSLAAVRTAELQEAVRILGVTDHRFLGEAGARWGSRSPRSYSDSGMRWGANGAEPTGDFDPASLTGAEFGDVAADIAAVILDVHPDAVVSYNERGGYGHPDHVRAHEAARRAADVYGVPFFSIEPEGSDATPSVTVDVDPVLDRKRAALEAYRSQLTVDGDSFTLSGGQRQSIGRVERFSREPAESTGAVRFSDQPWAAKFFASVVAGVIGVAVGALLTVYNQSTASIAGQNIWVGVIAAGAIVAGTLVGFRLAFGTRIIPAFAAVGMIVIVAIFSFMSAGGTVLIAANGQGITWQILPTAIAVIVLVWPPLPRRAPGKIAGKSRSDGQSKTAK